jgi:hypothetical protein
MMRRNVGELLFCHRLNQVVEFISGRTRTRTWDPLIKSLRLIIYLQSLACKRPEIDRPKNQWVKKEL